MPHSKPPISLISPFIKKKIGKLLTKKSFSLGFLANIYTRNEIANNTLDKAPQLRLRPPEIIFLISCFGVRMSQKTDSLRKM